MLQTQQLGARATSPRPELLRLQHFVSIAVYNPKLKTLICVKIGT